MIPSGRSWKQITPVHRAVVFGKAYAVASEKNRVSRALDVGVLIISSDGNNPESLKFENPDV